MISATDALQLPGAQLAFGQKVAVSKMLEQIEKIAVEQMARHGFVFTTSNVDPAVQFEVNFLLTNEYKWDVQCQPAFKGSKIQGGAQRHTGYSLMLIPSLEATRAARSRQG